jgi:hypothetical protein
MPAAIRWSVICYAFLSLQAFANGQTAGFDTITSPSLDQNVAAGSSLDIIWQPSMSYQGTITIKLLEGATPSTLSVGPIVAGSKLVILSL